MNNDVLKNLIKKHEGYKSHPYLDQVGKVTIGYGHNIDDLGISEDEAEYILDNDIVRCKKQLSQYTWFLLAPEHTQIALIDMCFNMGLSKLLGFKRMIMALINKDYRKAAEEALDSKWAMQVGNRAKEDALMMREGYDIKA